MFDSVCLPFRPLVDRMLFAGSKINHDTTPGEKNRTHSAGTGKRQVTGKRPQSTPVTCRFWETLVDRKGPTSQFFGRCLLLVRSRLFGPTRKIQDSRFGRILVLIKTKSTRIKRHVVCRISCG